jgi:hypothetical protein
VDIPHSDGTTRGHTISDLALGFKYEIEVRARAGSLDGPAARVEVTLEPPKPSQPTGLVAVREFPDPEPRDMREFSLVALSWDDPADDSITKWEFRAFGGRELEQPGTTSVWKEVTPSSAGPGTLSVTADRLSYTHRLTIELTTDNNARFWKDTRYEFEVRAVNDMGGSKPSERAVLLPPEPSGLQARQQPEAVVLSWQETKDRHFVASYQYRQKSGSGDWGPWTDIPGSRTGTIAYTVASLTNGTTYTFQIRAVGRLDPQTGHPYGFSAPSDAVSATPASKAAPPPAVPLPDPPTGLKVISGHESFYLSWDDPGNPDIERYEYIAASLASDDYQIRRPGSAKRRIADYRNPNKEQSKYYGTIPNSGPSTTSFKVEFSRIRYYVDGDPGYPTVDRADWDYAVAIRAVDSNGRSDWSFSPLLRLRRAPLAAPSGVRIVGGDREVTLSWDRLQDASVTVWQYRQRPTDGDWGAWADIAGSGANTVKHTVSGLTNGQEYVFQVRAAIGPYRGVPSAEVAIAPSAVAPAAPANFKAVPRDGGAALSWDRLQDASVTVWQYRQRLTLGVWGVWDDIDGSGAGTVGHTVSGLTNGQEYVFQVRAAIGPYRGVPSAEVAIAPSAVAPAAPANFKAVVRFPGPRRERRRCRRRVRRGRDHADGAPGCAGQFQGGAA